MTMSDKRHVAFYAFFTVEQSPLPLELFFFFLPKKAFFQELFFFWGGGTVVHLHVYTQYTIGLIRDTIG